MILEGSANGRFKGEVRLGVAVGDSTFAGRFVPRDGASAISLRAGASSIFVRGFELLAGAEALVAARLPEPRRIVSVETRTTFALASKVRRNIQCAAPTGQSCRRCA